MPGIPRERILINGAARRAGLAGFIGAVAGATLLLLPTALPAGEEKPKAEDKAAAAPAKPAPTPGKPATPPVKPVAAPAKTPARPAPAVPAATDAKKEAPLSFTDDDLEKFHKPQPVASDESSDDEASADQAEETGATPAAPAAPAVAKPAPARPAVKAAPRVNPVLGPPPTEDPLKKWKQQGALDAMRQQQIETLRAKIAGLKSRLDYLNAKKDGLLNPGPPQVASTTGNAYPPTTPPDPNKPPPPPNYKPDISPGRTQKPMGLIFPSLPEPQTDQDRENDKSMKIADLLENVKKEIESVTDDLKRANDDLITIETRAAGENPKP